MDKPAKPSPDYPLFAHASKRWAKKVKGKLVYFGPWTDPAGALQRYRAFEAGQDKVAAVPRADKPMKPANSPLYPASNGQWAKKVKGKTHCFGPWADHAGALEKWLEQKDALLAGRKPRVATNGLTVGGLVNDFLTHKQSRVDSGELAQRTFDDYQDVVLEVAAEFGTSRLVEDLGPDDFEKLRKRFAKTHGPVALLNDITRVKVMFNFGKTTYRVEPDYGAAFQRPTKLVLRREKGKKPKKMFQADEIRVMLDNATVPLKAMILLGINCGFGNGDCAMLEMGHLDLEGGWYEFPRPKTGIDRRAPLWPETVDAIEAVLAARPKARDKDHADRVFITAKGETWERTKVKGSPVSKEMAKLLKTLELHKTGRNFYSLRHTMQTIGDRSGQSIAVKYIMGHAPSSDDISSIYREETFEGNLVAVCDYVRTWLFTRTESRPAERQGISGSGRRPSRLRLVSAEMLEEPLQALGKGDGHQAG